MHIVAIIMTAIMILHIRSKYTAVGRKEIVMFFWMYMVIEFLALFLDSGVIPTANSVYPVRILLILDRHYPKVLTDFSGFQQYIQV